MKWINVEDEEPKHPTRKLCFGHDMFEEETYRFFACYGSVTGSWYNDSGKVMRVLFWMDGPEDPQ